MASRGTLTWADLGLVVLGGTAGTAVRAALLLIEDPTWQILAVPAVNIAGSLLLGFVLGVAVRSSVPGRQRVVRLLLGAGVLGGFTTYSSFGVQAVSGVSGWITLATLVLGPLAAWLGLVGAGLIAKRGDRS